MSKIMILTPCLKTLYRFNKDQRYLAVIEKFEDEDVSIITFSKDNTMSATFYVGKSTPVDNIYTVYDDNEKFFNSKNENVDNFFTTVKEYIATCNNSESAIELLLPDVKIFLEKWKEFDNEKC